MTKPASEFARRAMLPVAFVAMFLLASCGIKGPLELPEGTQASDTGKGGRSKASELPGYVPTTQDQRSYKQLGRPEKPDQPFVLDPLLN